MDKSGKTKKRSYRVWYMLAGFLTFFVLFIYLLIKPSIEGQALDDLQNAGSVEDVRVSWEKHKTDLAGDEDYLAAIRGKLSSFNLSAKETGDCLQWLPKPPESLNLIVVPDLSGRIDDEVNNPAQINNDTILMDQIWQSFKSATQFKMNSSDRLIVDVTGGNQASGGFRAIANHLVFDLSDFKDKSYRLYFRREGQQYQENVARLYQLAKQNPQGAEYWSYFDHDLKRNLRTSNLFTSYRNVLIILTDGYLEAQTKQATGIAFYTGTYGQRSAVFNKLKAGASVADATSDITPIMDCSDHFPDLEVLILEVNGRHSVSPQEPRDPGTPRDLDILKKLWTDWFVKLQIKNASGDFFGERLDATDLTRQKIREFIKGNNNN